MSKKLEKLGRLVAKELTEERGVFLVMKKDDSVLTCAEGTGNKMDIARLLIGIKDGVESLTNDYGDIEQEEREADEHDLHKIKRKLMKALRRKKLVKRDGNPSSELIAAMIKNAVVGKEKRKSFVELLNGLTSDILTDNEVKLLEDEATDITEDFVLTKEDED